MMQMVRHTLLLALLCLGIPAWAQSTDTSTGESQTRDPRAPGEYGLRDDLTEEELANLPFPVAAYRGAEVLRMEPEFVHGIQTGLQKVYLRKYEEAKTHFSALEDRFPNTGLRSVIETLVWQAKMLENFDYRYDKQYWASSKQARRDLGKAMDIPGNEAWEHLLMGTILGIEAIHTMRQSRYLSALQLAFQALDQVERSRAAAPDFVDLQLADGLYNYWRTVVTLNSKILPDFGDHRPEGIRQMKLVEEQGIFMGPMATLSLAFTWMEENDMGKAVSACARNRGAYPDNIVNNLVMGMATIYKRDYDRALHLLDQVHRVDSENDRAHYWKGIAQMRKGDLVAAQRSFETYLAGQHLEKYQRSYAHYRLGQVASRRNNYGPAADHYAAAIKVDGHKGAKRALDRLKERRKEGGIEW